MKNKIAHESLDKMTQYWYENVKGKYNEGLMPQELIQIERIIDKTLLSNQHISDDNMKQLMGKWESFVKLWVGKVNN